MTLLNSQFTKNLALVEGGAIKWNFYEPLMLEDPSNTFINNSAGVYGNNIASVPKLMICINNTLDLPAILGTYDNVSTTIH